MLSFSDVHSMLFAAGILSPILVLAVILRAVNKINKRQFIAICIGWLVALVLVATTPLYLKPDNHGMDAITVVVKVNKHWREDFIARLIVSVAAIAGLAYSLRTRTLDSTAKK